MEVEVAVVEQEMVAVAAHHLHRLHVVRVPKLNRVVVPRRVQHGLAAARFLVLHLIVRRVPV